MTHFKSKTSLILITMLVKKYYYQNFKGTGYLKKRVCTTLLFFAADHEFKSVELTAVFDVVVAETDDCKDSFEADS